MSFKIRQNGYFLIRSANFSVDKFELCRLFEVLNVEIQVSIFIAYTTAH